MIYKSNRYNMAVQRRGYVQHVHHRPAMDRASRSFPGWQNSGANSASLDSRPVLRAANGRAFGKRWRSPDIHMPTPELLLLLRGARAKTAYRYSEWAHQRRLEP